MVELYCGKVGGGKSYCAVLTMLKAIGSGRPVASNIALNWAAVQDYCKAVYGTIPDISQFTFLEGDDQIYSAQSLIVAGSLLVLDELNIYYPSRGFQANAKKAGDFLGWLVQSRKYGCDVIAIIQSANNLDAQIRRQALVEWHHADTRQAACSTLWGLGPRLSLGKFLPRMFARSQYWAGDYKEATASEYITFDMRVGKCYQTNAIFKSYDMATGTFSKPVKVSSRKAKLGYVGRHPLFVGFIVVLFGCAGCFRVEKKRVARLLQDLESAKIRYDVALTNLSLRPVSAATGVSAAAGNEMSSVPVVRVPCVLPTSLALDGVAGDIIIMGGVRYASGDTLPDGSTYLFCRSGRILLESPCGEKRVVPYSLGRPDFPSAFSDKTMLTLPE